MSLPALYRWVEEIPNPPKMIAEALKLIGTKEFPGKAHNNPVIMNMAEDLGIKNIYPNDETAWCAVSQCWICLRTGKPLPGKGKGVDLLRAYSFFDWGDDSPIPMFGDILVFDRDGGYHVGLYIAEDITHYHVCGGNQKNSYSIVRINKDRKIACRRYYSIGPPGSVKQIIVAPDGQISHNEV